jgi:SulP family sulfate permease
MIPSGRVLAFLFSGASSSRRLRKAEQMSIERKAVLNYLSDLNPWHNVRLMGTNVRLDLLSGLTVAVIALPLALAFGVASGLGAITGVWGAICGGIFVGLFGGSATAVSGPTGPKTVQLAAVMEHYRLSDGGPDLTFAFGIVALSGIIMVVLAFMKVGRFIYYTPYSVISGFMCGIGAIIIILQINPFLGLTTLSSIKEALIAIPSSLMQVQPEALLISAGTFATILVWPRMAPITWLPGPLVGLVLGTLAANVLDLKIAYIGEIPTGMPQLYLPDLSRIAEMIAPAAALAGLAVFDSLLTCLVADNMTGDRHHSDREILGQGIANVAAGLAGGLTTATATMRTVANIKCGARSGLAAVTHGGVLLALVLGLAPLTSYIPMAALAGILVKIGVDIIDYRVLPVLHRMPLTDKICFWAVFGLTVWVDLLVAMGVGLAIAFFRFVHEMSDLYDHQVVSLQDVKEPWPGEDLIPEAMKQRVLILRPEGPLFFGAADTLYRTIERLVHFDVLIIRLRRVPIIDLSGAYALEDLIEKAHRQGAVVLLTSLNPRVRKVLEELGILDKVGLQNCFDRFEDAVGRVKDLLSEVRTEAIAS